MLLRRPLCDASRYYRLILHYVHLRASGPHPVVVYHDAIEGGHFQAVEVLQQLLDLIGPVDVRDGVDPVPCDRRPHRDGI